MTELPIGILIQVGLELLDRLIEIPLVIQRDRLLVVCKPDSGGESPRAAAPTDPVCADEKTSSFADSSSKAAPVATPRS